MGVCCQSIQNQVYDVRVVQGMVYVNTQNELCLNPFPDGNTAPVGKKLFNKELYQSP